MGDLTGRKSRREQQQQLLLLLCGKYFYARDFLPNSVPHTSSEFAQKKTNQAYEHAMGKEEGKKARDNHQGSVNSKCRRKGAVFFIGPFLTGCRINGHPGLDWDEDAFAGVSI